MDDIRERMFGGMTWYDTLQPASLAGEPSAWAEFKAPVGSSASDSVREKVIAALHYAERVGVWDHYERRFRGVKTKEIQPATASSRDDSVAAPLWSILNEPLVALVLHHGMGWEYLQHEPPGKGGKKGDWLFRTASGVDAFVEVKTISEYPKAAGAFGSKQPIHNAVDAAYRQLSRSVGTVVVIRDHVAFDIQILAGRRSPFIAALYGEDTLYVPVGSEGEDGHIRQAFRLRQRGFRGWAHLGAVLHVGIRDGDLYSTLYPNECCDARAGIPSRDFGAVKEVRLELDRKENLACLPELGDPQAITWHDTVKRLEAAISAT